MHPVNPKAPAKNMGLVMFYVSPHVILEPGQHETEETYVILEGQGVMSFANFKGACTASRTQALRRSSC
jgi:mannose-6-phosphate isomerase-like protein (cupin superfamily)